MRISTANNFNASIDELIQRQSNLASTQQQMTSGKRVNRASDDPAAAAQAERATAAEARSTASQRAVNASQTAMTLTESALGSAGDLLQTVREGMVSAGNASFSDSDRKSLADQLTQLRNQLLSVANTTDGAGTYLFGGQGANQAPFVDAAGGVQYYGSSGSNTVAASDALPLTIDGQAAWMQAPTGNGVFAATPVTSKGSAWIASGTVTDPSAITGSTYSIQFSVASGATTYSILKDGVATPQANMSFTPGQAVQIDGMSASISGQPANGDAFQFAPSTPTMSVFSVIDKAITDLRTPGLKSAQIAQNNAIDISSLDSVMGKVQAAQGQAGAVLNRIDSVTSRLSDAKLASQTEISNAVDVDMTKALSDFSNQNTGYDAALKAYSMIQGLSMFKYLSA